MHRLLIQVRSYTGLGLVRAILVGFGGLGDVQGGEVHMRARIQGAGRGHYQAQAPAVSNVGVQFQTTPFMLLAALPTRYGFNLFAFGALC